MKTLVLAIILIIALCSSVGAQDNSLPIHGFMFGTMDKEGIHRGHVWLISKKEIMPKLEVLAIVAPLGPPKLLQNLQVTWSHPYGALTAGRFIPPISREWYDYRIDRLPTIFFSSVSAPLAARDVGIEASSTLWKLTGKVGGFSGQRMGGNVPISERGKPDLYASGRFEPVKQLSIGLGARFGPVRASAADVLLNVRSFTASAELVSSEGELSYHYILGYAITPRLSTATRYEHLAKGARKLTIGIAYKPYKVDDHELKLNYITSKQNSKQLLGQVVLRW